MLSLDHHLDALHKDLANMEALRGTKDMEPGLPAEAAARFLRSAGEAAALFLQESLTPDRIPVGHGGPRSD